MENVIDREVCKEVKPVLTVDDVENVIYELSFSQGFYGRLYRAIQEMKNDDDGRYEAFCNIINEQAFSDAVDVVLFFET